MRNNQPVINEEYVLSDGAAIISRTNAKGVITDCNHEFIEASGFTREELIGKPHNLVRHPDMPPEAFRDLWDTIKRGRPWVGIVKNRRKNGGFYWVRASVTPLPDEQGYSSVRTKPSREEIAAAEHLYKRLWNDRSIRLLEGRVVGTGLGARLGLQLGKITMAGQLWLTALLTNIFLLAAGIMGTQAMFAQLQPAAGVSRMDALLAYLPFQLLAGITLGGGLLALGLALLNTQRLRNSVETVAQATRAIAAGDLTRPLPPAGQDEMGYLIAKIAIMRNSLHELIARVRQNVDELEFSAHELTQVATSSAQASEIQSDSAASMAATVEQLSVSVDLVEENARQAYQVTQASGQRSEQGARVINDAANEMERIAASVHSTAETIRHLEEYSRQITSVTSVIKDIADQTNLLALNAAIEAARAGEQGRGFAVVADEVRKLAERTARSTEEITEMIAKIQQGTHRAATEMEAGVSRVGEGVMLAREAGQSMAGIREDAALVMQAVEEISGALEEQVVAAREIARRVEQIATISESNSASATQTATSAQQLEKMAHHLHDVTTVFRIT
jgi:aerotaxis receptor